MISAQCSECQSEEIQPSVAKQRQTVWTQIRLDDFVGPDQSCDFVGPDQSCADPGIFVRKGVAGGPGMTARKQP